MTLSIVLVERLKRIVQIRRIRGVPSNILHLPDTPVDEQEQRETVLNRLESCQKWKHIIRPVKRPGDRL